MRIFRDIIFRLIGFSAIFFAVFQYTTSAQNIWDNKENISSKAAQFKINQIPKENITMDTVTKGDGIIGTLTFVQSVLLKLVLPLVLVGSMLYIAYELFTAEGDEGKMKKAWSAVTYAVVAIVSIMLSSLIIGMVAGISLK